MTLLYDLSLLAAGFGFGVFFVGAVGMPWARRRGRAYTAEEVRVLELPTLIRDHHPKAIVAWPAPVTPRDFDGLDDLPRQYGTLPELPEHKRRLELTAAPHVPEPPSRQVVTTLAYRRAQALLLLDRIVAPLRTSHGRHRADETRVHGTIAQRRFSRAAEQREVHDAALERLWDVTALDWQVDEPEMVEVGN